MTFPWPRKGDKAFAAASGGKYFHLPWAFLSFVPPHARAFKEAADLLLDTRETAEGGHLDALFFPIAFLYRHSLELKLKEVVHYGLRLDILRTSKKLDDLLKGHNLAKLWSKAKAVINERWPGAEQQSPTAVEAVVNEFHHADSTGQAFRYDRDTDGKAFRHEKLPKAIDSRRLRKTMDNVWSFLDGCCDGLDDSLRNMGEY